MKLAKVFFLCLFIFNFSNADNINIDLKTENRYHLQKIIDSIYFDIIDRININDRCQIFNSTLNMTYDLGISRQIAELLLTECPQKKEYVTRYFKKKYYFVLSKNQSLNSWTNLQNETTIYTDENFNYQSLYLSLLHEFAVTYDAKSFLYYSQFLKWNKNVTNRFFYQITGNNLKLSEKDFQIRNIFNKALWSPIRYTFTAMRAFSFEDFNLNQNLQILSHDLCIERFKFIFPKLLQIKDQVNVSKNELTQYIELFSQFSDDSVSPSNEIEAEEFIQDVLSNELIVKENGTYLTFCQYMSIPKLTSNSYDLSLANGPRPRLTNPNNGQGGASTEFSKLYLNQNIQKWKQKNQSLNIDQAIQTINNSQNEQLNNRSDLLIQTEKQK